MNDSIWQSCPVCKNKGKTITKPPKQSPSNLGELSHVQEGGGKGTTAEQINCNQFSQPLCCITGCKKKIVSLCSCGVVWPRESFQSLNICSSLAIPTISIPLRNCIYPIYPSTVSVDVFVDIKKSNVIEESLSQGTFMAGFQSHRGSERSLSCCRWGSNSWSEARPFEVFFEKYPGSGCIQQKLMLTCGTGWG